MRSSRVWWALLADLVCVLAFAAGGKSAHDDSSTWWVIVKIVWPFALACLMGWIFVWRRGWDALHWRPAGVTMLVWTYVLGMVLRVIGGRGIAVGFLVVALVFLTVTMLGWRLAWAAIRRRRRSRCPRPNAPRSGPASTPRGRRPRR